MLFILFLVDVLILKKRFVFISCALSQVLELEQQHSIALKELSQSYTTEKEQLLEQHQLQLQVSVTYTCVSMRDICS